MRRPSVEDATAQHVRRTLRAIELLAQEPHTQADLARELEVHRRTSRRLLARLVDEGYAEPLSEGRHVAFQATSRLIVLGRQVADGLDILAIARRHLASLDNAEGVGARFISVLADGEVSLAHIEDSRIAGPGSLGVLARTAPLHATAAGKVFLSADTGLVDEVLSRGDLVAYTERTVTARGDLLLELATVRERGFATEDGEHHADIRAAASGVFDHTGRVVAAMGVIPIGATSVEEAGGLARAVAVSCSREIGAAV